MPLLDRNGLSADPFIRLADGAASNASHILVPWADLADALARRTDAQQIGVELANTVKASDINVVQEKLALIAIGFPAFGDGRGFSLARQLRKIGFKGTLRAVGPLIADQFASALACGFDEIELPDAVIARQPVEQWLAALRAISHGYQRGYREAGSILDLRRAARHTSAERSA